MKKVCVCIVVFLMFISCYTPQGNEVFLFNNVVFSLNDNEQVIKIDANKKELFDSYYNQKNKQIPLYKCIKSDNYLIFIGVPINTSLSELANDSLSKKLTLKQVSGNAVDYIYKSYGAKNEQVNVYARNFDNNLLYVLAVSNTAKLSDSLFNVDMLSKRFKSKK